MNYSRRRAVIVVGGALAGVALNALPGHAASQPTITSPGSMPDSVGKIAVNAHGASPIVAVTARIYMSAGGAEIATVSAFDLVSGTDSDGTWRSREALLLPSVGDYWITYEVRAADGGVAVAGTRLYYWAHAEVTIGAMPMTVDAEHRSIVASGRIVGRHPGTLQLSPLADFPVDLMVVYHHEGVGAGPSISVASDAEGNFGAVFVLAASAQIWANSLSVPERFVWYSAQAESPMITVNLTPTRLHLGADITTVVTGTPIQVRGRLERQSAAGWVAFAGQRIAQNATWESTSSFLTTDADGSFSATVTPPGPGTVHAAFNNDPWTADPYFAEAYANLDVRALRPVTIEDYFTVQPSRDPRKPAVWDVIGYVKDGLEPTDVQIQIRPANAGVWSTIKTVQTTNLVSNTGGHQFIAELELYAPTFVRAFVAETILTLAATSKQVYVPGSPVPRRDGGASRVPIPRRG